MSYFVYIWLDRARKMFYVGSHEGEPGDGYISSSRWMNYEYRFRPQDFKRRIVKKFEVKRDALLFEYSLITKIDENEFAKKYYNLKIGKPKGVDPWNKGRTDVYSEETLSKMSTAKLGNSSTSGMTFPSQVGEGNVMNRQECRDRQRKLATGRKLVTLPSGKRTWVYPNN